MSKFISFEEVGDTLVFTTDTGATETVAKGSRIAEILLAEVNGTEVAPAQAEEVTPTPSTEEAPEAPVSPETNSEV